MSRFFIVIGSLCVFFAQIDSHAFELEHSTEKSSKDPAYSSPESDRFLLMEVLEALFNEIRNGKEEDFTDEEFFSAKAKLRTKLEVLISKEGSADRHHPFVNAVKNDSYRFFLEASLNLLHNISLNDVYEYASLEKEPQMEASQMKLALREQISSAQTFQASGEDLFLALPIDDNEKKIISSIITTMAEKNVIKLGLMRRTLEKKGKRIHHVHPLRFLGYKKSEEAVLSGMVLSMAFPKK